MTPERAEKIRNHWHYYRNVAREQLKQHGYFRVPEFEPLPSRVPTNAEAMQPVEVRFIEFRLEHGYIEDKPASRIVCEGLELENGPRR